MVDDLSERLLRHVQQWDSAVLAIQELRPVTAGASQEIWALQLVRSEGKQPVVLRRARHWNQPAAALMAGMRAEAQLLRLAASLQVPVPELLSELQPADDLGAGYLMSFVAGETAGHKTLRDPGIVAARPLILEQCAQILARLHAVPARSVPELRTGLAEQELHHWRELYCSLGVVSVVFEYALRWLSASLPPACEAVLVHGDFRHGNLVLGPEGVRAVLDWELSHWGDPMEDLGWFCVNAWRFGAVELAAGGLGTRAAWYQAYERAAGVKVDPEQVRYWEVLGNLKWGISCIAMGQAWQDGSDRRIERLAIARRVSEVEADLLQLITPETAP